MEIMINTNEMKSAIDELNRSAREIYYSTESVSFNADSILAKAKAGDKAGAQTYLAIYNLIAQRMANSITLINISTKIIADELNKRLADAQVFPAQQPLPITEAAPEPTPEPKPQCISPESLTEIQPSGGHEQVSHVQETKSNAKKAKK